MINQGDPCLPIAKRREGESETTDPLAEALISLPRFPGANKKEGRQVLKHDALPPIPELTDGPAIPVNTQILWRA